MNKEKLLKIADTRLLKVTDRPEIIMQSGHGMYLRDTEGNDYLDFIGGWAVNCLGHSPKVISDILADLLGRGPWGLGRLGRGRAKVSYCFADIAS